MRLPIRAIQPVTRIFGHVVGRLGGSISTSPFSSIEQTATHGYSLREECLCSLKLDFQISSLYAANQIPDSFGMDMKDLRAFLDSSRFPDAATISHMATVSYNDEQFARKLVEKDSRILLLLHLLLESNALNIRVASNGVNPLLKDLINFKVGRKLSDNDAPNPKDVLFDDHFERQFKATGVPRTDLVNREQQRLYAFHGTQLGYIHSFLSSGISNHFFRWGRNGIGLYSTDEFNSAVAYAKEFFTSQKSDYKFWSKSTTLTPDSRVVLTLELLKEGTIVVDEDLEPQERGTVFGTLNAEMVRIVGMSVVSPEKLHAKRPGRAGFILPLGM